MTVQSELYKLAKEEMGSRNIIRTMLKIMDENTVDPTLEQLFDAILSEAVVMSTPDYMLGFIMGMDYSFDLKNEATIYAGLLAFLKYTKKKGVTLNI